MVTGTQFNTVQPFSFFLHNNGNTKNRVFRGAKTARRSSSALNSVDSITSKSTGEIFFAFGQVSSFSATNPFSFHGCEVDKISDQDAEKPIETASKLQHENNEPRVAEKEGKIYHC